MKLQVMALITREKRTRGLQTCLCHNLNGNGLLQPVHVASSTFAASPMSRALPQVSWLACFNIMGFCPGLISTALRKSLYGAIPADRRGIRLQPARRVPACRGGGHEGARAFIAGYRRRAGAHLCLRGGAAGRARGAGWGWAGGA